MGLRVWEGGRKSERVRVSMDRLPPVHPGEVLWEDFMKPLGLSQYRVAKDIGVPALRISQIVRGRRAITADTALRLARYFGTSAGVWLRLQARYDLEVAEAKLAKRITREVKVLQTTQVAIPSSRL
jgi:addiction module HigA family antidote